MDCREKWIVKPKAFLLSNHEWWLQMVADDSLQSVYSPSAKAEFGHSHSLALKQAKLQLQ